jgi:uncharacterized RDD family membrane protein YckC
MNTSTLRRLMPMIALMLCTGIAVVHAEPRRDRHAHGNDLVSIGHDSHLLQGQKADSVVSIAGSSTSEGEAESVVSVLGNTRVTGPVSDSAVAVLGNTHVDSKIEGDAVAVLGDVELGPNADIAGDVVAVGGKVLRDPAAIVHGDVHDVFGANFGSLDWLSTWVHHCLLYGRPLALAPGLGWAWSLAFICLALYILLALMFRPGLSQCVRTFETQPGRTLLAALIAMLLTPVLVVLLCVTVIGIAAVPFVLFALFCAGLFGKAVMLAWIGKRIVGERSAGVSGHPAFAVLIGGVIVLLLYLVPVLGYLVFQVLGILGFGTVVYALILAARTHQAAKHGGPEVAAIQADAPIDAHSHAPGSSPPVGPAGTPVTAALPRAGFWVRMVALLLDVLLVGFATSLLHPLVHMHLLLLGAYGAVMWKFRGSTIGGTVFDLRVVRVDGRPMDWETSIIRALSCFLSLAVAGLGFFWIAFDDAHQAWHDKIAGTVVVRVPKGVPLV